MRKSSLVLSLLVVACSSSPAGPGGGNGAGSFSASIDGQAWVADALTISATGGGGPGSLALTGTRVIGAGSYTSLLLFFGFISGPGTYPLGVNQGTTAGGSATLTIQQPGSALLVWTTPFSGAAGTVTITAVSSTRIAGTFQFSATPQIANSATGTRVVSSGSFDVNPGSAFSVAPSSSPGSKLSATLGGTAWNAATIVAAGSGNVFAVNASTDSYSITLSAAAPVSAGNSYPLGGLGGGPITVSRIGTSNSWTGGTGVSIGSLTIASFGGGRATGTFTATLVPGAGTSGGLTITNGAFDIAVP